MGPCSPKLPCDQDINGDGEVDMLDTVLLLDCWGPCPCNPPGTTALFDTVFVHHAANPEAAQGMLVTHAYATGADVAVGDVLLAVSAQVETLGTGVLYQHPDGGQTPPVGLLCELDPSVCYDTFVTMGLLTDDAGTILAAPDLAMDESGLSGSWFVLPGDPEREAVDISGITGNPGQAGVLIAQISWSFDVNACGTHGYSGAATLFTSTQDGGSLQGTEALFFSAVVVDCFCLWDCANGDGEIGIEEFLAVLGTWGQTGVPCDFDGGGVGITDFLKVLGLWGPCP